ncbi:MAG: prephenate dehydrogenase [Ruminococcaceae bacterium]|nr:prephenate dehydrogenase [Oscillospiraceae bacterium]
MITIGIVGLGLIGASLAKSAKKNTEYKVFGFDKDHSVTEYALLSGIIDEELAKDNLNKCDVVFICLYPSACVKYVKENADFFKKDSLVLDCAGIKRSVCEPCFEVAEEKGFHFIGGHPMAGTQHSGIKYSKDTMFYNACFVLVPKHFEDIEIISKARETVLAVGFSRVSVMNAERHDELIAYTSQLAHVVSNAYVKSPCALSHKGISAGSYRDLTRVAYLNENMWTELFMDNKDNLLREVEGIISSLNEYAEALRSGDEVKLKALLLEGKKAKEAAEG